MKRKYIKERQRLLHELIIKTQDLNIAKAEIEELNDKVETLNSRLETAGSEIETLDNGVGSIQVIHASTQSWGQYFVKPNFTEEEIPVVKERLVLDIAKGLAKANIVQFIHKQREALSLFDGETFAAKLFVIPWEQMRTKSIKIERLIPYGRIHEGQEDE